MSAKKPMRLSYTDLQMRRDSIEQLEIDISETKYDQMKLPSTSSKSHDYLIKLLIIGDSSVGKSCMLLRFCDDSFTPSFIATVGIDFKIRTIEIDGKRVKLQIWDTAGQERFRTITTAYYRGAMGIIFAFDVTNMESFEHMGKWMDDVLNLAASDVDKVLVGCKCDLKNERTVGAKQAKMFAEEHQMPFLEVSSKENINVDKCVIDLAQRVKSRLVINDNNNNNNGDSDTLQVHGNTTRKEGSRCCK